MSQRLLRLLPWMIRSVVPAGLIGTYVLHRAEQPIYVGRSDTDLRRRLLEQHALARGDYFTFDVHPSPEWAFYVESSLFHALKPEICNRIHPDRPDRQPVCCPFCRDSIAAVLDERLQAM